MILIGNILFLVFVLSLFDKFALSCRAFRLVGTKRRQILHSKALPSRPTPKMAISDESGTAVKNDGLVVENFDLGRWQAGGINSFSKTCFAEYWDDLPSVVSDADNDNEEAVLVVNPYDFRHRMALQKYLIEHTGGESIWGTTGEARCSKHPIWGYAAQLDWMHRSGRFEDPSEWQDDAPFDGITKSNTISKRSWWGYMNLGFSVASYCGAAEAGLVPSVSFSNKSVANDVVFQTCVGLWKDFWENDHFWRSLLLVLSAKRKKNS